MGLQGVLEYLPTTDEIPGTSVFGVSEKRKGCSVDDGHKHAIENIPRTQPLHARVDLPKRKIDLAKAIKLALFHEDHPEFDGAVVHPHDLPNIAPCEVSNEECYLLTCMEAMFQFVS